MYRRVFWGVAIVIGGAMPISDCVAQDLEEIGWSNMLNLPIVKDLEFSDEQKLKLKEANNKFAEEMKKVRNELIESLSSKPELAIRQQMANEATARRMELNKQQQEEIWEILLPHQQRLIVRQAFWTFVNESKGLQNELSKKYYAEKLKLTGKQKVDLKLEGEKLQKEFQDDIANLRIKFRRKMEKEVLSKEQSEMLKKLMGESLLGTGGVKYIKF